MNPNQLVEQPPRKHLARNGFLAILITWLSTSFWSFIFKFLVDVNILKDPLEGQLILIFTLPLFWIVSITLNLLILVYTHTRKKILMLLMISIISFLPFFPVYEPQLCLKCIFSKTGDWKTGYVYEAIISKLVGQSEPLPPIVYFKYPNKEGWTYECYEKTNNETYEYKKNYCWIADQSLFKQLEDNRIRNLPFLEKINRKVLPENQEFLCYVRINFPFTSIENSVKTINNNSIGRLKNDCERKINLIIDSMSIENSLKS